MKMKSTILAITILFLLFAGCYYRDVPPTAVSGKMLYVDHTSFDFGYVPQGFMVKHNFVIENVGSKILQITDVSTTCDCVNAHITNPNIASEDSAYLTIEFNSTGYFGVISKYIIMKTNDPRMPSVAFTFIANMDYTDNPFVLIEPREVLLGMSSSPYVSIQNISDFGLAVNVDDYYPPIMAEPVLQSYYIAPGAEVKMKLSLDNVVQWQYGSVTLSILGGANARDSCRITIPILSESYDNRSKFW